MNPRAHDTASRLSIRALESLERLEVGGAVSADVLPELERELCVESSGGRVRLSILGADVIRAARADEARASPSLFD